MRASEAMARKVCSVGPETTVAEAARIMCVSGHGSLPVLDADGRFLGVVSKYDLVRHCLPGYLEEVGDLYRSGEFQPFLEKAKELAGAPVAGIMDTRAVVGSEDMPLAEVASLMVTRHVHQIPVLRQGKLLGVIGLQDVISKLAEIAFCSTSTEP